MTQKEKTALAAKQQEQKPDTSAKSDTKKETDKKEEAPAPEPQSEKLTEIRGKIDVILGTLPTLKDRKALLDANMEIYKLTNDEKAEIANIKKAENEAKLAEQRNNRVKMVDDLLAAYSENLATLDGGKNSGKTMDEKNAINDTFHKLRESVVNELLAKYPKSSPASSNGSEKSTGVKGATSVAIREKFIANRASGMTDTDNVKAIIAEGFSRGTTGAVVLAYQREIGEKE